VLHAVLPYDRCESVSGDLLEAYRVTIQPARGTASADMWYIRQVAGFVWRAALLPGAIFGGAVAIRTALDWLVPPTDFHARATASTYLAITILLSVGCWASWRSGSLLAGSLAGLATTTVGAGISLGAAMVVLAVWHDAQTMAAIGASGGIGEALSLPILMIFPGVLLGTVGGVVGASLGRRRQRML
jgi:hypothetical protein